MRTQIHSMAHLILIPVTTTALCACGISRPAQGPQNSPSSSEFVATSWYAAPMDVLEVRPGPNTPPPVTGFNHQTVRQIARLSAGGDALRIKFSNRFGTEPLVLDRISVAKSTGSSAIDPASIRPVLFSGRENTTLPPGAEMFSDTISLSLAPLETLAVSIYMKQAKVRTAHHESTTTTYLAEGDVTRAASLNRYRRIPSTYFMPQIDVVRHGRIPVVVTFGDSITDGAGSTPDAHKNYPDQLSTLLNAAGSETAVANAGIGGNRWVKDIVGPSGNSRFERDVLGISGVSHVIILLGINDLGLGYRFSKLSGDASQLGSADQVMASIQAAIDKAKLRGLKVYVGTLMPFKGAEYFSDGRATDISDRGRAISYNGEEIRQEINRFIRSNKSIDGVIDFDLAMRDPQDPLRARAAYNSGDGLHPNDAGYKVMSDAVGQALR